MAANLTSSFFKLPTFICRRVERRAFLLHKKANFRVGRVVSVDKYPRQGYFGVRLPHGPPLSLPSSNHTNACIVGL
jgi:hypothetical protein